MIPIWFRTLYVNPGYRKDQFSTLPLSHHLPSQQRSRRERGLRERAARQSIGLPVDPTWVSVPLLKDLETGDIEMVSWPMLLPKDFALCLMKQSFPHLSLAVGSRINPI